MEQSSRSVAGEVSFATLLYLYLWPFWLFRDVRGGSLFEQAAAYRHNRAQRIHLPGYLCKWALLFILLIGCTGALEHLAEAYWAWATCCTLLAGATGILACLAVVVMAVTGVAYLFLDRWQG